MSESEIKRGRYGEPWGRNGEIIHALSSGAHPDYPAGQENAIGSFRSWDGEPSKAERLEYAERAVACVNACAGIPTASLPNIDRLRVAAEALVRMIGNTHGLLAVFLIKDSDEFKELTAALATLTQPEAAT